MLCTKMCNQNSKRCWQDLIVLAFARVLMLLLAPAALSATSTRLASEVAKRERRVQGGVGALALPHGVQHTRGGLLARLQRPMRVAIEVVAHGFAREAHAYLAACILDRCAQHLEGQGPAGSACSKARTSLCFLYGLVRCL